jgi:hypothetical protein
MLKLQIIYTKLDQEKKGPGCFKTTINDGESSIDADE